MPHSNTAAALLLENITTLQDLDYSQGILDLACGSGRNGLFLVNLKIPVTFADNNKVAIDALDSVLQQSELPGTTWLVDFESGSDDVLVGKCFDGIIIFNYLYRPLMSVLKQAIRPGGIIFYETFTVAQREFGRPGNPDYLLRPNELSEYFNDWQILHYFEGELAEPQRAVAQIIARRPDQADDR